MRRRIVVTGTSRSRRGPQMANSSRLDCRSCPRVLPSQASAPSRVSVRSRAPVPPRTPILSPGVPPSRAPLPSRVSVPPRVPVRSRAPVPPRGSVTPCVPVPSRVPVRSRAPVPPRVPVASRVPTLPPAVPAGGASPVTAYPSRPGAYFGSRGVCSTRNRGCSARSLAQGLLLDPNQLEPSRFRPSLCPQRDSIMPRLDWAAEGRNPRQVSRKRRRPDAGRALAESAWAGSGRERLAEPRGRHGPRAGKT
jgi:hypothetical protein